MLRNIADQPLLLIVLLLIIVLVFGAKRLPDAARSLGRSMRIFKSEVKEMRDDDKPGQNKPGQNRSGQNRSGQDTAGGPSQPLEGRVVPGDEPGRAPRDPQGHEPRRDT